MGSHALIPVEAIIKNDIKLGDRNYLAILVHLCDKIVTISEIYHFDIRCFDKKYSPAENKFDLELSSKVFFFY